MSEENKLRIHAQIRPEEAKAEPEPRPIRWRSRPHPDARRGFRAKKAVKEPKPKLSFGDRLLRNSALACAALLAILAVGNIDQPWARQASETVRQALTMRIDLDESIGGLSFVKDLMPESALVFLNLSGESELAVPASGELSHAYSDAQPWLLFACGEGSEVVAVARSEAEEDDLPEESDASVSADLEEGEAPAEAASDLDMDIPETTDTPEDEL